MNCFNHSSVPALGLCKSCSKGLCSDCLTDLGHGIACKGEHEQNVIALDLLISQSDEFYSDASLHNAEVYSDKPKALVLLPAFLLCMGVIFVGFALYEGRGFASSPVISGLGFIFFGVLYFMRNRTTFSLNDSEVKDDD